MDYRKNRGFIVIRFDEDEEIVETLVKICLNENLRQGVVTSLVGALKECELIFREGCQKVFREHLEILGTGNISMLGKQPKIHLHIVGGNESTTVTGHLVRGTTTIFCEAAVLILEGFLMERTRDDELASKEVLFPYRLKP